MFADSDNMYSIFNTYFGLSMQHAVALIGDTHQQLELPDADDQVMPGVQWGRFEEALTPAFWVVQAWMQQASYQWENRLGKTLTEEVTGCLLGGHGAPAEVGLAAYHRVRDAMVEAGTEILDYDTIEQLLLAPLEVNGRRVRYRFARQRAKYLTGALKGLRQIDEPSLSDVAFRAALMGLPGIGPKTASWIVRNRRSSDDVAILDVHIIRAGHYMGFFPEDADPTRNYLRLEQRFLEFCRSAAVRASHMDAVIWSTMRSLNPRLLKFLVAS
jgi:thermostable 8-oxoguanine DNA glycosylase